MKVYQAALYPFSVLYDGVTRLRNHLYELEIKKSVRFEPVVINVGNLAVGGTGKTPMIEYLIRMLQEQYSLATLSRGYGRKTRGFRIAGEQDTAETLGDEPFQFYQAWKGRVVVSVGEQRAMAIPQTLYEHPEVEIFLLDDAYQHRSVTADFNILLTTWQRPFFKDYVLPAGRLRESGKGAARAQAIVVTKCPVRTEASEMEFYRKQIARYAGEKVPVFFSSLSYGAPQPLGGGSPASVPDSVVLVSGLAKADLFEAEARKDYKVLRHFSFPDHYRYKEEDLKEIRSFAEKNPGSAILTTEKDGVKWLNDSFRETLEGLAVFTLPVRHHFLEGKEAFKELILKTVGEKKKV